MMETIQKIVNVRPDSFSISINAKGQYSGEVKVYAETAQEAMEKVLVLAMQLEILIKEKNTVVEK